MLTVLKASVYMKRASVILTQFSSDFFSLFVCGNAWKCIISAAGIYVGQTESASCQRVACGNAKKGITYK